MGTHQPIRKIVTPEIPDKLYFRIGDVARLCEVPAYVLRFWETEFPQLKPNKGGTGQRLYRKRDVEMALRIKSLLYDQGYTIPGARQVFKSEARAKDVSPAVEERAPAPRQVAGRSPSEARPEPAAAGDEVRAARLHALREDMHALLAALTAPVGTVPLPGAPEAVLQRSPRLGTMRPRLVTEPAEAGSPKASPRPVLRPSLFSRPASGDDQADLFPPAPAPALFE